MKKIFLIGLPVALWLMVQLPLFKAETVDEPVVTEVEEEKERNALSLNLTDLVKEQKMPQEEVVNIQFDHFFKTSKTYRAYSFNELLKPYLEQLGIDSTSNAVVTFHCTDGYKPTKKVNELLTGEGYLAFRDEGVDQAKRYWPDSISGKFSPFYLVWENVPYGDQSFTWPYGLYKIQINKVDELFNPIYPQDDSKAAAGFELFKENCLKCHSINKIGGEMAPDLNYPKSITSYWATEDIWGFVKDPQSYRYNAKMPPATNLTRAEFDEIMEYLNFVKTIKPKETTTE